MAEPIFMKANEVAKVMDISVSFAYQVIREMNAELKKLGCITIHGRIDRKFFYSKFYSAHSDTKEG